MRPTVNSSGILSNGTFTSTENPWTLNGNATYNSTGGNPDGYVVLSPGNFDTEARQTIDQTTNKIKEGAVYTLQFEARALSPVDTLVVGVYNPIYSFQALEKVPITLNTWTTYSVTVYGLADALYGQGSPPFAPFEITIYPNTDVANDGDVYIDNVVMDQVPDPILATNVLTDYGTCSNVFGTPNVTAGNSGSIGGDGQAGVNYYANRLYFFNWAGDFNDGIQNGDQQVFNIGDGISVTATISNVSPTGNGDSYQPTDMTNTIGGSLELVGWMYSSTGNSEALRGGQANGTGITDYDVSWTMTFEATKDGQPYPLDLIAFDAEITLDINESLSFTTNGSNWGVFDRYDDGGMWYVEDSGKTVRAHDTQYRTRTGGLGTYGGNTMWLTTGPSSGTVIDIKADDGGREAVGFAVLLPCGCASSTTISPYVFDGNGWANSSSVTIYIDSTFSLGTQTGLQSGLEIQLPDGSTDTTPDGDSYFHFTNASPSDEGTYIITYTDASGCTVSQTYTVEVLTCTEVDCAFDGCCRHTVNITNNSCCTVEVWCDEVGCGTGEFLMTTLGPGQFSLGATPSANDAIFRLKMGGTTIHTFPQLDVGVGCLTYDFVYDPPVETCPGQTSLDPYVQDDGGNWTNSNTLTLSLGDNFSIGTQTGLQSGLEIQLPDSSTDTTPDGDSYFLFTNAGASHAGTYTVTYTDASGCVSTQDYTVLVTSTEICDNGVDDNGDGLIDNADPDCSSICISEDSIAVWHFDANNNYTGDMGSGQSGIAPDNTNNCGTVTNMNRRMGTNSTTYGNTGNGICIGAFGLNNSWVDNAPEAIEFTITFPADKSGQLSKLEFYQQSPTTNWWIPENIWVCNNPANKYGIRVLKDGIEIYKNIDLLTASSWQFESFDFSNLPNFQYTNGGVFKFELMAYEKNDLNCWNNIVNTEPVMWDLDEVKVFGCCLTPPPEICDNGIDDDGDGLIDCNDPDCTSGNADTVVSQIGVSNSDNALGAPNGSGAEFYDVNDQIVLDLTDEISAGNDYTIRWRRDAASSSDPSVQVEESTNGVTYSAAAGSPFTFSTTNYFDQTITTGINTRYLRLTNLNTYNFDLDAISYSKSCSPPEICDNSIDDDGDGLADCNDDDCFCDCGYITNSSFENGLTDWTSGGGAITSNEAHTGINSLVLANTSDNLYRNINTLSVDSTYELTFWAKVATNRFWSPGVVIFYDASNNWLGQLAPNAHLTTTWEKYSIVFTIPANTAYARIEFADWVGGEDIFIDDVCLTATDIEVPVTCSGCFIQPTLEDISRTSTFWLDTTAAWTGPYLVFEVDYGTSICHNPDGTITIQGNMVNQEGATGSACGWFIELTLSDKQDWATFGGSYDDWNFVNGVCSPDNHADWDYWAVSGTLTGLGCNSGQMRNIIGNQGNYRVQVGYGASRNQCNFGMAGWFEWDDNGTTKRGDIYFELDENCYDPQEICDNGMDDDGDGLTDCADPDCLNGLTVTATAAATDICAGSSTDLSAAGSGGNGSLTYTWDNGLGAGANHTVNPGTTTTYSVTISDGTCTATSQVTINVVASVPAQPGSIMGNNAPCQGSSQTYSINAVSGATSYNWVVPVGWTIISGQGTTSINVTTNGTAGDVCVSAENICGNGNNSCLSITPTTIPLQPGVISGNDPACESSVESYSISAVGGAASYTWTVPAGWTIDSGQGTTSITVTTGINGGNVCVTADNICGNSSASCLNVTIGCSEICDNGIDDDGDGLTDCADPDCLNGLMVTATAAAADICAGSSTDLSAAGSGGNGGLTYTWDNGLGAGANHTVNPIITTTYTVTVSDGTCTATDEVTINPVGIIAINDSISLCPGANYKGTVAENDTNLSNTTFSVLVQPTHGSVVFASNGSFTYTPINAVCETDEFSYQVCNQNISCCANAIVHLTFEDNSIPVLVNIPVDDTVSCDEEIPLPPLVSAFDNCPAIGIHVEEESTQGEDGCSLYDYTITRTWTATDLCGNSTSSSQIVEVQDVVAPDIFRIYTLPNGKKMVAGVMEFVGKNWKIVNLPIDFDTKPMIFHQVVTTNDASAVVAQIRGVSVSQFELRIMEEENNDNKHIRESVAWIAIESGTQTTKYQLEAASLFLTESLKGLAFQNTFTASPALFTSLQTTNEFDPAFVRNDNLNSAGVTLNIQEEASKDAELAHTSETTAYLAIENIGTITSAKEQIIGEVGKTTLSSTWKTVYLNNYYANPVIIASNLTTANGEAATIRIRNVGLDQFQIRVEEWDYLDGVHPNETVSYLVIEGSIPLDSPHFCENETDSLEIGIDIKAIDNCDASVVINYSEIAAFFGARKVINRTWSAMDECGNSTSYSQEVTCEGVALQLKATLQGALIGSNVDGLMRDDLRKKQLIPVKEPYSAMDRFQHYGDGGNEIADTTLFETTGANAVVDWVFVELRAATNRDSIVATCAGLIQRDGDVMMAGGDSIITFTNVPIGDYYVCIRHRNHLGLQSLNPYTFSTFQIPFVDFTYTFTPVVGDDATVNMEDMKALWAGDLNNDGRIIYQGPQNDIFDIFLQVLLDSENTHFLTNFISTAYTENDFNLDGTIIFQGPNNDRSVLLFNTILKHPDNQNKFPNFIILIDP